MQCLSGQWLLAPVFKPLSTCFFLSKLHFFFFGNHSNILGAYLCLKDKDEGSKSVSELEHDAKV